jgi:hypothetical protein
MSSFESRARDSLRFGGAILVERERLVTDREGIGSMRDAHEPLVSFVARV